MFLSDVSIKRPVFATMMMVALVVLGIVSYQRLAIDEYPDVSYPVVLAQTTYPAPALTNVGIVLPEPGYLDAVRAITRATGTILIIDETHTICAGPAGATAPKSEGGSTRAWSEYASTR